MEIILQTPIMQEQPRKQRIRAHSDPATKRDRKNRTVLRTRRPRQGPRQLHQVKKHP